MCLAQGSGHREAIASQLHLSINTVRTHFQNIMAKLGVHSTLEAVAFIRAARPVGEQPFPPKTRQGPGPSHR
jgi:DNA-binding NarL/FixJ family response regulator